MFQRIERIREGLETSVVRFMYRSCTETVRLTLVWSGTNSVSVYESATATAAERI